MFTYCLLFVVKDENGTIVACFRYENDAIDYAQNLIGSHYCGQLSVRIGE